MNVYVCITHNTTFYMIRIIAKLHFKFLENQIELNVYICINIYVVCLQFTARAALLTGRLPIRNGFYTTNDHARNGKYYILLTQF